MSEREGYKAAVKLLMGKGAIADSVDTRYGQRALEQSGEFAAIDLRHLLKDCAEIAREECRMRL